MKVIRILIYLSILLLFSYVVYLEGWIKGYDVGYQGGYATCQLENFSKRMCPLK